MEKTMETFGGGVVLGVIALFGFWFFHGERWLDLPQQRSERLTCEMAEMDGVGSVNNGKPKSAADAEAYCDKEMEARQAADEAEKAWLAKQSASNK